jgi:hypothetical protein
LIQGLGRRTFNIGDAYAFAPELSAIYPKNQNVKPKIRQQLQVLRDLGLIRFVGRGEYEVRAISR